MLFSSAIGEDTLKKYYRFWEQLLCYIYRMQEDEQFEEVRPSYQLTQAQQDAFNALVRAADNITDRIEATDNRIDRTEAADNRIDRTEEAGRAGSQKRLENEDKDSILKKIN